MATEKEQTPNTGLVNRSQQLVNRISQGCQAEHGFGGFSASLYDASWVSMVTKRDSMGVRHWVFPEAFEYVLLHQDECWETYSSPVDMILKTMASLLAILEHRAVDAAEGRVNSENVDYERRIFHSITALFTALHSWDVGSSLHVGFEILVPSLLHQLKQRGVDLDFPGKEELNLLHQKKLSKFSPEMVTSKYQTTMLHSLEGLIGKVDFGKLRHHCTADGGMMGSPASTAAYLIHSPVWDDAAEQYLKHVIQNCEGVPSAFPTPIFETSWTISTLLASGYAIDDFPCDDIRRISSYLQQHLERQHGLLGFAPTLVPDADDTARSYFALSYLKTDMDPAPMVKYFEASEHFQTYKLERNPSFSANANILLCLLRAANPSAFASQIEKAARFLISCWVSGELRDKWNLAAEYSHMLLANALLDLVVAWSKGHLTTPSIEELIKTDIPIVVSQLFSKTVADQWEDGSWGHSVERTAYSILLLAYISRLPWPVSLHKVACASLLRGKGYLKLHASEWSEGEYIWIEKINYRLPILCEAYCLAAMKVSADEKAWTSEVKDIFTVSEKYLETMSKFLEQLPLFQSASPDRLLFAMVEARFYQVKLNGIRLDIFPRDNLRMSKDKYLEFIPVCWTTVNATNGFPLSGEIMWDMMVISMLNYQVDEYMESVVGGLPESSLSELKSVIEAACFDSPPGPAPSPRLSEVTDVILRFIRHVRHHRRVLGCPPRAQMEVAEELRKFLHAHMEHNADNSNIKSAKGRSYFDWVRSTGANDTSCPYSFSFFTCLISCEGRQPCISTAKQRYFARALGLHLATMCRQYNDFGSCSRDQQENNLNSLDFSEFNGIISEHSIVSRKQDLMDIADFERSCMQVCFSHLSGEIDDMAAARIKAFIDVTDLFGQIYVAQDIASRLKR